MLRTLSHIRVATRCFASDKHHVINQNQAASKPLEDILGENPLSGSASSGDLLSNSSGNLDFASKEDAIAFCQKNRWNYDVKEVHERKIIPKRYGTSFKCNYNSSDLEKILKKEMELVRNEISKISKCNYNSSDLEKILKKEMELVRNEISKSSYVSMIITSLIGLALAVYVDSLKTYYDDVLQKNGFLTTPRSKHEILGIIDNMLTKCYDLLPEFGFTFYDVKQMSDNIRSDAELISAVPLIKNVDQLGQWRERCADHVTKFKELLDECNDRVNTRKHTEETCHQEMVDYVYHMDHCAMPKTFASLK